MRIGIDYRPAVGAPSSGIGRQVLAMEQALHSCSTDTVWRYSGARYPSSDLELRCPPREQPREGMHRPQHRLRFEGGFLPQALHRDQIELYIATANRGLPLQLRRPNYRQAVLIHDMFQWTHADANDSAFKRHAYHAIERASLWWSLRRADVIWAPSRYTMDEVARIFPQLRPRLRWLPNAVLPLPRVSAEERSAQALGLPSRYWLMVGTRGARKNLPRLLHAWLTLRQQGATLPDLALVGHAGDVPEFARGASGLHLYQGIDDVMLAALYQGADRLWHPSYGEGFGLPVVEALAAGTAVAVATGSALDEVTPPDAPRFDPYSQSAIEHLMLKLQHLPPAPPCAARQAFAAQFDASHYGQRLAVLIDELRR